MTIRGLMLSFTKGPSTEFILVAVVDPQSWWRWWSQLTK